MSKTTILSSAGVVQKKHFQNPDSTLSVCDYCSTKLAILQGIVKYAWSNRNHKTLLKQDAQYLFPTIQF